MRRRVITGFFCLALFDAVAQISFKFGGQAAAPFAADWHWLLRVAATPWSYSALLGYLGAFYTWLTLLKHAPIGSGFAATHLQIVCVLGVSAWLFNEALTAPKLVGSALILTGIVLLGLAESRNHSS